MIRIIAGSLGGRQLKTPKGSNTRPTQASIRESLFNQLQGELEGTQVLDLFAGSGAIGFEALSRGADAITFCEKDASAIRCLQENARALGVESRVKIIRGDSLKILERMTTSFDLIYVDPPYRNEKDLYTALKLIFNGEILSPEGRLYLETSLKISGENLPGRIVKKKKYGGKHLLRLSRE